MQIKNVDIIIPVYNALEDVKKCISSVIQYTDFSSSRVFVIDDCSTDEKVIEFLNNINHENIKIILNKTNNGFSNNVNLGMSQSEENDVILLNSDTIVTEDYVTKLRNCAYSRRFVATVTPLSNNGVITSVPDYLKENEVPTGFNIDSYAKLVQDCSLKHYPEIPVGMGFCLYITRQAIKDVGLFDAETFGKGYGEENDFCYRAIQMGYVNLMCDDTYIYHKGTASFTSNEKKQLIIEHTQFLAKTYHAQFDSLSKFTLDRKSVV